MHVVFLCTSHPYLDIEVQSANIDEDAGPEVKKSDPTGLVQVVGSLNAGQRDAAS